MFAPLIFTPAQLAMRTTTKPVPFASFAMAYWAGTSGRMFAIGTGVRDAISVQFEKSTSKLRSTVTAALDCATFSSVRSLVGSALPSSAQAGRARTARQSTRLLFIDEPPDVGEFDLATVSIIRRAKLWRDSIACVQAETIGQVMSVVVGACSYPPTSRFACSSITSRTFAAS
jgi:hypothetical protein